MKNDIYFNGKYYDSTTITEKEKTEIKESNPDFFAFLVEKYNLKDVVKKAKK